MGARGTASRAGRGRVRAQAHSSGSNSAGAAAVHTYARMYVYANSDELGNGGYRNESRGQAGGMEEELT